MGFGLIILFPCGKLNLFQIHFFMAHCVISLGLGVVIFWTSTFSPPSSWVAGSPRLSNLGFWFP